MPNPLPPSGQGNAEEDKKRRARAEKKIRLDWLERNGQGESVEARRLRGELGASASIGVNRTNQSQNVISSILGFVQNLIGGNTQLPTFPGGPAINTPTLFPGAGAGPTTPTLPNVPVLPAPSGSNFTLPDLPAWGAPPTGSTPSFRAPTEQPIPRRPRTGPSNPRLPRDKRRY